MREEALQGKVPFARPARQGMRQCPERAPRSRPVILRLGYRTSPFRDLDGVYRFPVDRAARIALETTSGGLDPHPQIERVTFVLFSDEHLRAFEAASA